MNNCLLWCSFVPWFSEISLTFFVEYICTFSYVLGAYINVSWAKKLIAHVMYG